jgi:hypothetical protein
LNTRGVVPSVGGGRRETSKGKEGEAKGRNMVAAGGSFVAHDLEDDYVTEEKSTCFNGIFGSKKVGQTYRGPYTIFVFLK